MSAGHTFAEFGRNLRRSPLSHIGSLVMSTALFALFLLIWIGSRVVDEEFARRMSAVEMEIFFNDSASDADFNKQVEQMRSIDGIARVSHMTKADARKRLETALGRDYLSAIDSNPLPRSVTINFAEGAVTVEKLVSLDSTFSSMPGVIKVGYNKSWLDAAEANRSRMSTALSILFVVTLGAAMLNATLLAGLVVRAKTGHFRRLRMLGASIGFLSAPLTFEGALLAALSAGLSWVAIMFAKTRLEITLSETVTPQTGEFLVFIALAALVGALGSFLAARVALWRHRV